MQWKRWWPFQRVYGWLLIKYPILYDGIRLLDMIVVQGKEVVNGRSG